jgi:biotin transporter BioY
MYLVKEVAFIAGKSKNQAAKKNVIRFFIDNLIANISLYALSWPKLNFGCYLTFINHFLSFKTAFLM